MSTVMVGSQGHSCVLHMDLKHALSSGTGGKYGRMFPGLPPLECHESDILALGRAGAAMDVIADDSASDNPRIPAGLTMFGHLIAHDVTADRSLLHHHVKLNEIRNFRTPAFDLECLYGAGPTGAPYMYDAADGDKFLLGTNESGRPDDLPRNSQGRAIIGDPRNDVHGILGQLQLAMLKFHNRVVDHIRGEGVERSETFAQAQRNVRWHLQWAVLHEFLPLTVGDELTRDVLANGPKHFHPKERAFIPVEFADAAYRFGHSQIRVGYQLNSAMTAPVFPDLAGGRPVPSQRVVDWRYFFNLDGGIAPQASRRIGPRLAHSLIDLPEEMVGATPRPEYHSLACRDMLRARALDLPSGEAIARHIGAEPLTPEEVGLHDYGWKCESPLFYYILREAELRHNGEHLGEVGGRIVAETLVGIIDADPTSYRSADPAWTPTLPSRRADRFEIADAVALGLGL